MWSSIAAVVVALVLAAAWWVAAASVSAIEQEKQRRETQTDNVRGGNGAVNVWRGGGERSAFEPFASKASHTQQPEQRNEEMMHQQPQQRQQVEHRPQQPQQSQHSQQLHQQTPLKMKIPQHPLQPSPRVVHKDAFKRPFFLRAFDYSGENTSTSQRPDHRRAQASYDVVVRRSGNGNADDDDDDDDGVLGRRAPRRAPARGLYQSHQTPTRSMPGTSQSGGTFTHTPRSTTFRSGRYSNTADAMRLYSSPSKYTGRGINNAQLVSFFADQEQSLLTSDMLSATPSTPRQQSRQFGEISPRPPQHSKEDEEWEAASQRIRQDYDEAEKQFTAALTTAVDEAAKVPRDIVVGYMKEEEIKAAQAAAAAQLKRDNAMVKLSSAVRASQPSIKELQDALLEAEEAGASDTADAKNAMALVRAATELSEQLAAAVAEGDTVALQKPLFLISEHERLRALVTPTNDRLHRLVNSGRKLIEDEQALRERQMEEKKRAEAPQHSAARFETAAASAGTQLQEELDDDAPLFVIDARRMLTDLERWESRVGAAHISVEISTTVTQCASEVRKILNYSGSSTSDGSKPAVIAATNAVERTLYKAHNDGADTLLYAAMQIFVTVLEVARSIDTMEKATSAKGVRQLYDLAHVVYSVCRVMKRGNKLFQAMCMHACPACVPLTASQASTYKMEESTTALSVSAGIGLMSAAIAHGGYEAFTTDDGWKWLIRYAHIAQDDPTQLAEPAEALCVFIHLCGKEVARRVGPGHFDTAMEALKKMVAGKLPGAAAGRLRSMLDTYLSPQTLRELPSRQLGPMDEPHILISATLVESLRFMEEIAASVDNSQTKRNIQKQINTAGNILTWDKLDLAVSKVFTAVEEARRLNDDSLLKFTLCYIAKRVATRSEMDQYSADAAPLLATFLSQIGQSLPDIPDLVRAKLYDICPDTVPHFWSASSVGEFIVKLKQQRPKVFEDTIGGETNSTLAYDAYLKLAERYMWTFGAMCVPPSDRRGQVMMLSFDDAWRWLAQVINACETGAPYHLAGVLEAFLKVTANQLDAAFVDSASGVNHFRNLLRVINDEVMPQLDDDNDLNHNNKNRLQALLNDYLA